MQIESDYCVKLNLRQALVYIGLRRSTGDVVDLCHVITYLIKWKSTLHILGKYEEFVINKIDDSTARILSQHINVKHITII